jgi:hypothetical protein
MRLATLLSVLALPLCLDAQVYREDFNYPNGPVIPGWTPRNGNWQVMNGRLVTTSGAGTWYITKDGLTANRCVLDGEFFFVGSGVQYAGLAARYPGSGTTNLLYVKIQNNGGVADFDRVFAYEPPVALGTYYQDIPGGTVNAYCRMIVRDSEFWIETDANRDGIFEQALTRRPITTTLTGNMVGMTGYSTSEMDNFEFFDAVLTPQVAALPRVGMNYNLDLNTPSPTVAWLGMAALGNTGFAIGSRRIPVDGDFMAVGTFGNAGFGFAGATDAAGNAVMSIFIPPIPALVGFRLFTSAVTVDWTQPFGVGNISNEHAFVIQP